MRESRAITMQLIDRVWYIGRCPFLNYFIDVITKFNEVHEVYRAMFEKCMHCMLTLDLFGITDQCLSS